MHSQLHVVAQFLNSFVRHANVLKIANLAQIVNVIAPIITTHEKLLLQTIFYPFEMFSTRREGISLLPVIKGPTYESKSYGEVSTVDVSAILSDGLLHIFLVSRMDDTLATVIDLCGIGEKISFHNGEVLRHVDPNAINSFKKPDNVVPRKIKDIN